MTKGKTGNSKFLKAYNETGILDLIRTKQAVSRAELSKETGLSPTAIGVIVSSLMEKEYIHEIGTGESSGGRKPVLLELKPDSWYSVGLDIEVDIVQYVLMDITGRVLHEGSVPLRVNTPEMTVMASAACVRNIMQKFSIKKERLLGVGISVPGIVDSKSRRVVLAPNIGWEDADPAEMLKAKLGLPVYIENEAMASAICENWIGSCQTAGNFVCLNIKSGIGAGIFTGGRPYRGTNGSAGEVGHIVVDENGPRCGCGNYGCLETLASTSSIIEKARRIVRQGVVSSLNEIENIDEITLEDIAKAARAGDAAAMNVLEEATRYIGIALSNLINTLNPSMIVLGKDFTVYGDLVLGTLRSIIDAKALRRPASNVEIVISKLGERASTLGAAIIPLKKLFGR
ncbi:MAG TPA: ROK family transcriptional regulator [Clostridiales bacterium]|nr:ROK family transcriptional regulator [Clostridiales bacterium]HOL91704.1 ROK family transcriptional regulator [Clostridiales bacterium]HPP35504.1 ROK family transcriptional regulator [Clostridiales bacterium]